MFRSIISNGDGTVSEGTYSEVSASRLLRAALRRGYRMEATRQGGVVIVRQIPHAGDVWRPARKHTVTLEPVTPAGMITATVRNDLNVIASRPNARLVDDRIRAGFIYSIPPAATTRLIQRGLVIVDGTVISVSLTAWLALLAQEHHTETREPRGYVRPAEVGLNTAGVERKGNKVYDRSSVASCSCHDWSYPAEDRDSARRKAHEHRQDATATMLQQHLTGGK